MDSNQQVDQGQSLHERMSETAPQRGDVIEEQARLLMRRGRSGEACSLIDAYSARTAAELPVSLQALRAQALLASGAFDQAATVFRKVLEAVPDKVPLHLGLAAALYEAGRFDSAESVARNAIATGMGTAGMHFVLGRALFAQERDGDAEAAFRNALRKQQWHVPAHTNLADLVWMREGDLAAATALIDATLRDRGDIVELHLLKSRLTEAAGYPDEAYAQLMRAADALGAHPAIHAAAAKLVLGSASRLALEHIERALESAPNDVSALGLYGDVLLVAGHVQRAADIAAQILDNHPHDCHALALRMAAWRMLGDLRYREVCDYTNFVRATPLKTPLGWLDLASYLGDLAVSLRHAHSRLRARPLSQSLRVGTQVELRPEHSSDPAIRALKQAIDPPIREYMNALGGGDDPLRSRNTGEYRLNGMWSVQLSPSGHHVNHYHGQGWLSSACHIEVPNGIGPDDFGGWLKFGEPGLPTRPVLEAEHYVRPRPGTLVLFPSWMWHGTVPFDGDAEDRRLTVAFDIVPVAAQPVTMA